MASNLAADGYGYGDGYGDGDGDGYGYGVGDGCGGGVGGGYGDGYGDGERVGETTNYSVSLIRGWGLVRVGCHVHSIDWWREHWARCADEAEETISAEEASAILDAASR